MFSAKTDLILGAVSFVLLLVADVKGQACQGNGFVGGCSDVFEPTGKPIGVLDLVASPDTAEVCEGHFLAAVYDCRNRIPIYVSIRLNRTEMDLDNPGRCRSCRFRPSPHLDPDFQAQAFDFYGANDRVPCYERRKDGSLYRDRFWTSANDPDQLCTPSIEPATGTSRGHLITDSYVRTSVADKNATYRFTNCIPQFQKFNSESWNMAEQRLYPWAERQCGAAIPDLAVRDSATLHVLVGVVPSTRATSVFGDSHVAPRWFGRWGFGDGVFNATVDYDGDKPVADGTYRVNMPAAMWTAACCVGVDVNGNVAWVRHMAFGRHAKPIGNDEPVLEADWRRLFAEMLSGSDTSAVDLFPNEPLCSDPDNYVPLSAPHRRWH